MEGVGSSSQIQDQFLTLLVTQLRNQDPLEPTKQEDFLGQLAQFSTLEGIEELNDSLSSFLSTQADNQNAQAQLLSQLQQSRSLAGAANLVGMRVEFDIVNDGTVVNEQTKGAGNVSSVVIQDSEILLRVDDKLIPMETVRQISEDEADVDLASEPVPASRPPISGENEPVARLFSNGDLPVSTILP